MGTIVNGFDIYGVAISLKFNRQSRFPTAFGAFLTIVSAILMIIFVVNRTMKLISKDDPFFSSTAVSEDD